MQRASLADWLSAIAAFFSAVTACIALWIVQQERSTPYKAALYTAQWSAISDYAEASAEFQSALKVAYRDVPIEVGDPLKLVKLSDSALYNTAKGTHPILDAWEKYVAAPRAAGQPFSIDVNRHMAEAEKAGRVAATCYTILGWRVDYVEYRPDWWKALRDRAAVACQGVHASVAPSVFDNRAEWVLRIMTDEAREGTPELIPGEVHNAFG